MNEALGELWIIVAIILVLSAIFGGGKSDEGKYNDEGPRHW